MQFDLLDIVDHHDDMEELCTPFTEYEINNIILEIPNGSFYKKGLAYNQSGLCSSLL